MSNDNDNDKDDEPKKMIFRADISKLLSSEHMVIDPDGIDWSHFTGDVRDERGNVVGKVDTEHFKAVVSRAREDVEFFVEVVMGPEFRKGPKKREG